MTQSAHDYYNKQNQPLANELRHNMTEAEIFLWTQCLRNSQLRNYSFRRQRPLLDYIVDFICLELKLVIEVDGSIHRQEAIAAQDERKEAALTAAGYTVLRFSNQEVLYGIDSVRQKLEFWIEDYEQQHALAPKERRERNTKRTF